MIYKPHEEIPCATQTNDSEHAPLHNKPRVNILTIYDISKVHNRAPTTSIVLPSRQSNLLLQNRWWRRNILLHKGKEFSEPLGSLNMSIFSLSHRLIKLIILLQGDGFCISFIFCTTSSTYGPNCIMPLIFHNFILRSIPVRSDYCWHLLLCTPCLNNIFA